MNSPTLSWLPLLILLPLLLFPSSFCNPDEEFSYRSCNATFSCGSVAGIEYPFRGNQEPELCGYPGFVLDCRDKNTTIDINNLTYRVLSIDPAAQTMKIAREDVMESGCPQKLVNTTLDDALFEFASSGHMNFTFLYGCPEVPIILGIDPVFSCRNSEHDRVYLVPGNPASPSCSRSVTTVADFELSGLSLKPDFQQVIRGGFQVRWKLDSRACEDCTKSKGRCGYNRDTNRTSCLCPDPPYVSGTCSAKAGVQLGASPDPESQTSTSPSKKASTDLALFITGAIVAGIGIGWGIFACRQRRKRRAAQSSLQSSQSLEAKSKDIPSLLPVSSSPIAHSSTNYSKSIPSYPSPKSEIGKASTYFGVQVFSFTELEESTDNFDPSRELGDGGFGTVYKGKLQDGRVVAVKRLYENNFKRVEQFMNEVEILTRLRHENLVTLHGCTSRHSRELLLVYEYIPNGTVADHLHGRRANSRLLSWPIRLNIAVETAEALAYLHASDTVHRDVKTNNILLDNDFHVKVADFGLSRLFPNDVTHVSTAPQGTPGYVDPEYYQCYQLTEKSDVYSFGVVLIELISSKQAVDTNRDRQDINLANMAVNKIQNHALHELVDPSLGFETNSSTRRMTTLVAELAFRCLQAEKDMRPTMKEVLEALRRIKNQELNAEKPEVVDIVIEDEVGLLQGSHPPVSPDSNVGEKWFSSSTTPNSSG
ncbi:LEAF RUST 10 DISEASE-RESISTANCE LOCUS RECEPTOR-LIKE PROTEIN KINASE-like 1.4 isoform X2 [Diospyros lotus]|uniref:LEAF RUST 10 DISEASE-RESISTANCE LOCUS RECEPTOR-LIKE PROTEIN KINASE-like 1.4 isoform X2 n=1 Tax=Diospyros lotus TaxID=55363 RepID=UPI00224F03DF|nr:LEAF RUST 10 DISEASE-RESISTANCE LOCUS RECEPTOR-LIKE PROTEIN KINASE-like 1.4 isoform X2 [Diospyros lotus]